ncbi:uncharacterized protein CLUP02_04234 [Colletotrichum lupini]|uniref:Uncharacterized protein n=1 Tax=Colletotrichum lupini TaxID=145971 RepID=A0A9Q8WDH8_9PEZI|nr:uncharacterized protein CLUP02_04234 [Colletotrichum lupini]UQC78757.1 hypothetical protein CLUP02_04234 [Colletotrichum lupini]
MMQLTWWLGSLDALPGDEFDWLILRYLEIYLHLVGPLTGSGSFSTWRLTNWLLVISYRSVRWAGSVSGDGNRNSEGSWVMGACMWGEKKDLPWSVWRRSKCLVDKIELSR